MLRELLKFPEVVGFSTLQRQRTCGICNKQSSCFRTHVQKPVGCSYSKSQGMDQRTIMELTQVADFYSSWAQTYSDTIMDRKNVPLQPPRHRCVAVAYLILASANHLPDSELTKVGNRNAPMSRWLQGERGRFFMFMIVLCRQTSINL